MRQTWLGKANYGGAEWAMVRQTWRGKAMRGKAKARRGRQGEARCGLTRLGLVWRTRWGLTWHGLERPGEAVCGEAGRRKARSGLTWHGAPDVVALGAVRHGRNRLGLADMARHDSER